MPTTPLPDSLQPIGMTGVASDGVLLFGTQVEAHLYALLAHPDAKMAVLHSDAGLPHRIVWLAPAGRA